MIKLSEIVRKYGKDPRGAAGYFKGYNSSMKGIAGGKRALTDEGVRKIEDANERFGEDWLDRIPLNIVSDINNPDDFEVNF